MAATRPGRSTDRGQTGIDFLVGVGVFLLTVGFVLAFVPGTLTPFTGEPERPPVADRAADTLVGGLVDGPEPAVLDTACTLAFFGVGSDAGCAFDATATTDDDALPDALGVPAFTEVNVTVERATGPAGRELECGVASPEPAVVSCPSGERLATGPPVPGGESVVVAPRTVYVDGRDVVMVVRVW